MVNTIITSVWTIIILLVGFAFGYMTGNNSLEKKIQEIKQNLTKPSKVSGAVKMLTKEEKDARKDTEGSKIRELLK
jgi:hypothetical protein